MIPLPPYANDLLATPLMGAGEPLVTAGTITQADLESAVDALVTLAGVAWKVMQANPHPVTPLAMLLALVKAAPADQQAKWNASVAAADAAFLAWAGPEAHNLVHLKVPDLLRAPVDTIADSVIKSAGGAIETMLDAPT